MDKQKTGELIKSARIKKGYTQVELGDLLGVTNKAISRWEKGDSFPDISVIEELSRVLDIRIQDIVIGDVTEPDSETAVTEVVRAAKLQDKVKKRKFISSGVSCIAAGYMLVCGWYSFRGQADDSILGYLTVSLAIVIAIMLAGEKYGGVHMHNGNAGERVYNMIGFASMGYCFIMMIACSCIFNNHGADLWKIARYIGKIINVQLIIVFVFNLAVLVIQDYINEHKYEGVKSEAYSLVTACFMSMMYACLLHTLSDMHSFNKYIMIIAVAAVIEMLAAYFISFRIKKHNWSFEK
jgi:transcriptional regulator with XRE-family HTH domain